MDRCFTLPYSHPSTPRTIPRPCGSLWTLQKQDKAISYVPCRAVFPAQKCTILYLFLLFPSLIFLCCSLRTGLFNKTLACIVCLSLSFLGNWTDDSRIMRYTSLKCSPQWWDGYAHRHTHIYIFKDAHLWLGITTVLHLNQPQTQVKVNISNYDHSRNLCTSPLSTWTFFPSCLWCLCFTCRNEFILLSSVAHYLPPYETLLDRLLPTIRCSILLFVIQFIFTGFISHGNRVWFFLN